MKANKDGVNCYYYGYRHLMQYVDNLNYLLHTSKLPRVNSAEMKGWLASVSGDKGTPFRDRVLAIRERKDSNGMVSRIKFGYRYTKETYLNLRRVKFRHKDQLYFGSFAVVFGSTCLS